MNRTAARIVSDPCKVIIHKTDGSVEEKELSAHDTLELCRETLQNGGSFGESGSSSLMPDGSYKTTRITNIYEKSAKGKTRNSGKRADRS